MSDTDTQPTTESVPPPPANGGNTFLNFVQQPRIVLIMLVAWSILTVITEAANQNGVFMDIKVDEIDGALGGLGLAWQGIPLAVLYADSARDPSRHRRIFWLALVHMGAAIIANGYHLGKGDFSIESIILPVAIAGTLFVLSFLQIFQPRESGSPTVASTGSA
ncbi:MAG: hypothetical protein IH957_11890 [Chloroflexi bacterium]|nr:hypothetical protein [Chloroflexota bacterium]